MILFLYYGFSFCFVVILLCFLCVSMSLCVHGLFTLCFSFSVCFILFLFALFVFFFPKEREKEVMDLDRQEGREDLEDNEGGEIVIKIHHTKIYFKFFKKEAIMQAFKTSVTILGG